MVLKVSCKHDRITSYNVCYTKLLRAIRDALLEHVQADIREPPSCIPTNIVKESHPQWDNGDIVSVWEALVDNQVVHQITNGEGWYVNPNRPVSPWAP